MNAIMRLHRAMAGYLAAQGGGGESKYIEFADQAVLDVLLAKGVSSDGVGITTADVEKVTSIGTWFKGNTAITRFDEYEKFKNATFNSNTGLNSASFNGCSNLKSIILPKTPTTMQGTFNNCSSLATVGNLEYVTKVDSYTFNNCAALKIKVNMPNLSGTIGDGAFRASGITNVISLGATTEIAGTGNNTAVFGLCANLQSINFPSTLMKLGASAFYGCTALEIDDLALPNLTSLGKNAFYGVKIKKISDLGQITALPTATSSTQNFGDKSVLEEIILPTSITKIAANSLYYYTALKSLAINWDGITQIGDGALRGVSCLPKSLILPSLTGTLGSGAIRETNIEEILDLGSITTFDSYAAYNCLSLNKVVLPETITAINPQAFAYCSALKVVVCKANTPPTLDSQAFMIARAIEAIYVPDASVDAYKAATNWAQYASQIKPLSEYNG